MAEHILRLEVAIARSNESIDLRDLSSRVISPSMSIRTSAGSAWRWGALVIHTGALFCPKLGISVLKRAGDVHVAARVADVPVLFDTRGSSDEGRPWPWPFGGMALSKQRRVGDVVTLPLLLSRRRRAASTCSLLTSFNSNADLTLN